MLNEIYVENSHDSSARADSNSSGLRATIGSFQQTDQEVSKNRIICSVDLESKGENCDSLYNFVNNSRKNINVEIEMKDNAGMKRK